MTLKSLQEKVVLFIEKFKDNGELPKENNLYDYKTQMNFYGITNETDIFMKNFSEDILSFSNGDGGIILIGIKENKEKGILEDIGLDDENIKLLSKIDLNFILQKFQSITKLSVSIDLQQFQIATRKFYYLLIEKQNQVIIPLNDNTEYFLKKGQIKYRLSGKNQLANESTQEFNKFLQIKANEKNKEFMEIWTKLLPEIFDINPREILMINPKTNRVYGFNNKDGVLSSSDIEIDKSSSEGNVFNVILNAISAGDIGRITNNEGKPLYKIVGEVSRSVKKDSISITTLLEEISKISKYKLSNVQLKMVMHYLGWVNTSDFKVDNEDEKIINKMYSKFLWIESRDKIKNTTKLIFSTNGIEKILDIIENREKQIEIFRRKKIRIGYFLRSYDFILMNFEVKY